MIKTIDMLLEELRAHDSPRAKLSRMVDKGEVYPVVEGLYETDRSTPGYLLAGSIYGPSYISFEFALGIYGMIPEAVYTVTCASFDKKKEKRYVTPFGTFIYRDVPSEAFPLGLKVIQEGDYYYRIATPEKALCDQIYTVAPVADATEMKVLLNDDLRIEDSELAKLNLAEIEAMARFYHTTNIKELCTVLQRIQR